MIKHKALALEGVGFGHKVLAILGTRWFEIDVVPSVPTFSGGGLATHTPAKLIISIKYDGKWIRREYKITKYFYDIVVAAKHITNPITFAFGNLTTRITNLITKIKLNKVESQVHDIEVKRKDIDITIRRK